MKIWSNTQTLRGYFADLDCDASPAQAEVALVGGKHFDIAQFLKLRGVSKCGVGTDNLDFEGLARAQVVVRLPGRVTSEILCEETAAYACHLILSGIYRNVGDFASWQKHPRDSVKSRCLLVIGNGRIGSRVAEKMRQFMRVETFDSAIDPPEKLAALLSQVDCITLHVPLSEETRGLIGAPELKQLRDGSVIVNTARGQVIDEAALVNELQNGRLYAAIDVFEKEPYQGPLTSVDSQHLRLSPHVASTSRDLLASMARDFLEFVAELKDRDSRVSANVSAKGRDEK